MAVDAGLIIQEVLDLIILNAKRLWCKINWSFLILDGVKTYTALHHSAYFIMIVLSYSHIRALFSFYIRFKLFSKNNTLISLVLIFGIFGISIGFTGSSVFSVNLTILVISLMGSLSIFGLFKPIYLNSESKKGYGPS